MQIFEEDIYRVEHEAITRAENVAKVLEPKEFSDLYRMAGYIQGVREVVNLLIEQIQTDTKEHHEAMLAELEYKSVTEANNADKQSE